MSVDKEIEQIREDARRKESLRLALRAAPGESPETQIKRADKFYKYLSAS